MISDWLDIIPEQNGQYDAWDETINPPRLWHCRDCNGMGYDPYTRLCQVCEETGIRWAWLRRLKKSIWSINVSFRIFSLRHIIRCVGCEKLKRLFGFSIGKHENCLPF